MLYKKKSCFRGEFPHRTIDDDMKDSIAIGCGKEVFQNGKVYQSDTNFGSLLIHSLRVLELCLKKIPVKSPGFFQLNSIYFSFIQSLFFVWIYLRRMFLSQWMVRLPESCR